jgi:uncharacterized membrane protein YfcA
MITGLIIFGTTFVATFLSAMSGGGASIINLPVFLSLGMPFPLATAVQKVSSAFWVLPAAYNYLHDRKIDWKFLFLFSGIGLLGAYIGVRVVLALPERTLELIVGVLILALVAYTFFKKDLGLAAVSSRSRVRQLLAYPSAAILGFYESIFGAGNGVLFSIIGFFTKGFDFIYALGYYFAAAFAWCVFAAYLLIQEGYYDLPAMASAVVGSVLGAYLGSRLAKYKGNSFIKAVFLIVGLTLGLKLVIGL